MIHLKVADPNVIFDHTVLNPDKASAYMIELFTPKDMIHLKVANPKIISDHTILNADKASAYVSELCIANNLKIRYTS